MLEQLPFHMISSTEGYTFSQQCLKENTFCDFT